MRLILVLLLMTVSIRALSLGNLKENLSKKVKESLSSAKENLGKVKTFFKEGNLLERFKKATASKFKKLFEKTGISSLGRKLAEIRNKVMDKLRSKFKLSKEKKAEIDKKLKEIEERQDDNVEHLEGTVYGINTRNNVGRNLFQSDLLLTKRQTEEIMDSVEDDGQRSKRQAFKDAAYPNTTWLGGVVFYRFDESADYFSRKVFEIATRQWQEASCIDFTWDKDNKAENSIVLIKEEGCWSYVGRVGGEQPLSLGDGCDQAGIAAHELGHALGLFHTMSRYDRDTFITPVIENVEEGFVDQYIKETPETTSNYGYTYDYGSIMHYGASSASHNKKPTMVANDTKYQESMGSQILSFIDKSMINDHYNCKAKCPKDKSAQCQNGGFPHPRNCSECICPSGYGGALCNERPKGCGQTYMAKETKQFLIDRLGFPSNVRDEYTFCNHWIEAPQGKKIEVKISSISYGFAHDGCILGGVEIKSSKDQIPTGYRFCSHNDRNTVLVSGSNRVPVITFNRFNQQQVILEYKIAQ
ncbi:Zinc metalloproteinase [Trichostrongylus colubriformis]|uniref:Zinc metalloproteinase n=1 Tax=Trichostrongylus colubriformis TaxID=6319 RepID=A0AAN8FSF7_TRICO